MKNTPEQTRQHCKPIETLLGAYVFEDLSAADISRVENHLAHCEACRTEVAAMRSVVSSLRQELATEDAPVLSADIHESLATLPVAAPRPKNKKALHWPASRTLLQVAATFVGLAALWMFVIPGLFRAEKQNIQRRIEKMAKINNHDSPLEYNAYPAGAFNQKKLDAVPVEELNESVDRPGSVGIPPATKPAVGPAPNTVLDYDGDELDDGVATRSTPSPIHLPDPDGKRTGQATAKQLGGGGSAPLDLSDVVFDEEDFTKSFARHGVTKGRVAANVMPGGPAGKISGKKAIRRQPNARQRESRDKSYGVSLGGGMPYVNSIGGDKTSSVKKAPRHDAGTAHATSYSLSIQDDKERSRGNGTAKSALPAPVVSPVAPPPPSLSLKHAPEPKSVFDSDAAAKVATSLTPKPKTAPSVGAGLWRWDENKRESARKKEVGNQPVQDNGSLAPPVSGFVVTNLEKEKRRDGGRSVDGIAITSETAKDLGDEPLRAEGENRDGKKLSEAISRQQAAQSSAGEPTKEVEQKLSDDLDRVDHFRTVGEAGAEPAEKPQHAQFKLLPVNPFELTANDNQSTFGLDTDTASYRIAQNYLRNHQLPPRGAIRMEEFVNAFDYNYPRGNRVFNIHAQGAPSPFGKNLTVLKIGVQGKIIGREARKSGRFVFLIDTSGSMARHDRMPLVIQSIDMLLTQLSDTDVLSIITYGPEPALILDTASPRDKKKILATLKAIQCGGSTNLYKGVQLAYKVARQQFQAHAVNRIVLFSDGATNVGPTKADDLITQVSANRRQGITFTSIGFGLGDYNDEILEALANKGDGNYLFVGTAAEARQALVENMGATAQYIAKDAKIQVVFNKDKVRRYRLIGYENRDIADTDFRNDSVDAGEVASGQSATALYEVELVNQTDPEFNPDLGTVYVRYRNMETNQVEEISQRITPDMVQKRTVKNSPRFFLAASAAEFAEHLRGSEYVQGRSLEDVRRLLEQVAAELPLDKGIKTLLGDVRQAEKLTRRQQP